jgi:flagellar biosynthesis/type III secretory pathway protein FliH
MPEMLTIHLAQPIARASCVVHGASRVEPSAVRATEDAQRAARDEDRSQELARLCGTVRSITDKLSKVYEETITRNQSDIARLAVEIARKVVMCKVASGDYDVQTIIEEALKRAPTHQNVVVRVNPDDLPQCQRLQHDHPDGPLAGLEFVADWSIARADCLVETPKGIIKSFVEQHLERIGEALMQVE